MAFRGPRASNQQWTTILGRDIGNGSVWMCCGTAQREAKDQNINNLAEFVLQFRVLPPGKYRQTNTRSQHYNKHLPPSIPRGQHGAIAECRPCRRTEERRAEALIARNHFKVSSSIKSSYASSFCKVRVSAITCPVKAAERKAGGELLRFLAHLAFRQPGPALHTNQVTRRSTHIRSHPYVLRLCLLSVVRSSLRLLTNSPIRINRQL